MAGMSVRLVLIHGTRMSHVQWDDYPQLLPEMEIVMPDLPGHGVRRDVRFTTDAALETIDEAVRGAAPDQRVVLAGHSLGGYLAMLYAAHQEPSSLAGLVMIGASAVPSGPGANAYRAFAAAVPHIGPDRMARVANGLVARLGASPRVVQSLSGGEGYAQMGAMWDAVMTDCRPELLARVHCSVLLLNGQFDQLRVHARRYAAQTPHARVRTVARATHLLPMTHPQQVAEILREESSRWSLRGGE